MGPNDTGMSEPCGSRVSADSKEAAEIFKLCWRKNNEGSQLPGEREGARGRGAGGWGAPERWNRGETGNEFPETGNKTWSQSVTPEKRGPEEGALLQGEGSSSRGVEPPWRLQSLGTI